MKQSFFARIYSHPKADYVILFFLVIGITILNQVWLMNEPRPPHWDMARHLYNSLQYWSFFTHLDVGHFLFSYFYYPPFLYWITQPFYLIFGRSISVAVLANDLVFLPILLYSTYGLGKELWNRRTGLLAALVVVTTPMLVSQFKEYQLDAALTGMVTLSLYLMVKSHYFEKTKYMVWLGVVAGFAMLTKWTFGLILLLPILVLLIVAIRRDIQGHTLARLKNVGFAILVAEIICGGWYLAHLQPILHDLLANGVQAGVAEGDPTVTSSGSLLWYAWNLLSNQLYIIPLVLAVVGIVRSLVVKVDRKKNLLLVLVCVGTYIAFTFLRNKDSRYTMPMLGAISVLAVYWFGALPEKARKVAEWLTVIYCFGTFLIISFGVPVLAKNYAVEIFGRMTTLYGQHGYIIGQPSGEQWHMVDALEYISNSEQGKPTTATYVGPDTIWFNSWALLYYGDLYKIDMHASNDASWHIVRTTPGEDPNPVAGPGFSEERSYVLPDASTLWVYKKS